MAATNIATKLMCFFLVLGLASPSLATNYEVGGLLGWNLGVDLNLWLTGKVFHVGDTLHFTYSKLLHNVVRVVDETALLNCNLNVKVFADDSGDTSFVLDKVGDFYFTSSLLTDCLLNLKIKVTVVA